MDEIWKGALSHALDNPKIIKASELKIHMIVRHAQDKDESLYSVDECRYPDGFPEMGIVRLVSLKNPINDWLYLHQVNGKMDDPVWIVVSSAGVRTPGDPANYQSP